MRFRPPSRDHDEELGFRYPVIVDVEGYRHRRRQKLEDIARRAADRAARQHDQQFACAR